MIGYRPIAAYIFVVASLKNFFINKSSTISDRTFSGQSETRQGGHIQLLRMPVIIMR
jgi:hypothetical protein